MWWLLWGLCYSTITSWFIGRASMTRAMTPNVYFSPKRVTDSHGPWPFTHLQSFYVPCQSFFRHCTLVLKTLATMLWVTTSLYLSLAQDVLLSRAQEVWLLLRSQQCRCRVPQRRAPSLELNKALMALCLAQHMSEIPPRKFIHCNPRCRLPVMIRLLQRDAVPHHAVITATLTSFSKTWTMTWRTALVPRCLIPYVTGLSEFRTGRTGARWYTALLAHLSLTNNTIQEQRVFPSSFVGVLSTADSNQQMRKAQGLHLTMQHYCVKFTTLKDDLAKRLHSLLSWHRGNAPFPSKSARPNRAVSKM